VRTAKSAHGVACTSLRRLSHPARALDWVPGLIFVFLLFPSASIPSVEPAQPNFLKKGGRLYPIFSKKWVEPAQPVFPPKKTGSKHFFGGSKIWCKCSRNANLTRMGVNLVSQFVRESGSAQVAQVFVSYLIQQAQPGTIGGKSGVRQAPKNGKSHSKRHELVDCPFCCVLKFSCVLTFCVLKSSCVLTLCCVWKFSYVLTVSCVLQFLLVLYRSCV